ncbi:MAG: LytTR family DNA-binding domain-containing protein [Proteiniphilum sp.]|jgi:two-component system response regulator LytT|uniref:LytR/AlgR family response regulator transcription factor n=1 Tax=Proteiniphilum sp. TaxID=1926877 RepID=UPI00092C69AC|nr:LytTR family DNA-binding domain-containing protein [Proteiniphilum sp.]MEA5127096.1 LytTR family DNA-binding domain-containing protein [Proteiniphilum sp.]OJV75585.1 MAG: DNA-binding response regulator [Bacteroidia bacterium 44-10]
MKAVIIEDETAAVRNLKAILNDVAPDLRVIAVLDSVRASVEWLKKHDHPDIVFMDIQLSDGESFLIFERTEIRSPVIFTTAYNEYALQAFKVNSIDYLLKPIHPEEVVHALAKLKFLAGTERDDYVRRIANLFPQKNYLKTLLISYKDTIIPVDTQEIACFYSKNEKVYVSTSNQIIYHTEKSLNALGEILDPTLFFRANRQFIVSRKAVKELNVRLGSRLCLTLNVETEKEILISKERVSELKQWLTMLY